MAFSPIRSPYFFEQTPFPYIRGPNYTRPVFREHSRQGAFVAQPIIRMPGLQGLGGTAAATSGKCESILDPIVKQWCKDDAASCSDLNPARNSECLDIVDRGYGPYVPVQSGGWTSWLPWGNAQPAPAGSSHPSAPSIWSWLGFGAAEVASEGTSQTMACARHAATSSTFLSTTESVVEFMAEVCPNIPIDKSCVADCNSTWSQATSGDTATAACLNKCFKPVATPPVVTPATPPGVTPSPPVAAKEASPWVCVAGIGLAAVALIVWRKSRKEY